MKLHHPEAEQFARIIWSATMAAWGLAIGGDDYPNKRERFARMKNPQPGDFVVEQSGGLRQLDCAAAVGWLDRVEQEPAFAEDEWDIETDGPMPLERVVYIKTIDGRDYRWVNCSFVQVPTYDGWWDAERWQKALAEKQKQEGFTDVV